MYSIKSENEGFVLRTIYTRAVDSISKIHKERRAVMSVKEQFDGVHEDSSQTSYNIVQENVEVGKEYGRSPGFDPNVHCYLEEKVELTAQLRVDICFLFLFCFFMGKEFKVRKLDYIKFISNN